MFDLFDDNNHRDAAITGLLAAEETFLKEIQEKPEDLPHFKVTGYSDWLEQPTEVEIDRDHNHQTDGTATITYDLFGNLESISVDRNKDGKADASFHRREIDEVMSFDYDKNEDGIIDATAVVSDRLVVFRKADETGEIFGQVYIDPGFHGPAGMRVDLEGNSASELNGTIDRFIPTGQLTSFGNS